MIWGLISLTAFALLLLQRRRTAMDAWTTHRLAIEQRNCLMERRIRIEERLASLQDAEGLNDPPREAMSKDLKHLGENLMALDAVIELSAKLYTQKAKSIFSPILNLPNLKT